MRKEYEEYKRMKILEMEAMKRVEQIKASQGYTETAYKTIQSVPAGSIPNASTAKGKNDFD